MSARRALFACDLDSQIFGALPLASRFAARNWRVTFALDCLRRLEPDLVARVSDRFEVVERPLTALAAQEEAHSADAVGVFATGSRMALFRHVALLAAQIFDGPRPALFCGFNGHVFERFEEGLAWRFGYDQIALNGPRDHDAFAAFVGGTAFAEQPVVVTGLRRRLGVPPSSSTRGPPDGARRLFVFAEQVIRPTEPARRMEMVRTLARLAAASPDWDVVIKARARPGAASFYRQTSHVEALVAQLERRPANLTITYESLDTLLPRADIFGTLSSTALFDALDNGLPCLLMGDLGVRNADGTHAVFGSGLTVNYAELPSLDASPRLAPDTAWLDRVGYGERYSPDALVDQLEAFEPSLPPHPSLYGFAQAARGAAPSPAKEAAIVAAWDAAQGALAGATDATAALARLEHALAAADRQRASDEAWRAREGRLDSVARQLGLHGAMRRLLQRGDHFPN